MENAKSIVLEDKGGLSGERIKSALELSLQGRRLNRVLIIPPDFTRFHSNAGFITNAYYHMLKKTGCSVDILPALGTHAPMTKEQYLEMFGDIPFEAFVEHNWRADIVRLGEAPGGLLKEATEGLWDEPVSVEVNRRVMNKSYDLVLSVGQVVPHEVVGMANHAKNIFVGAGGSDMINKSHMIGAIYGMERMMGKDHTPVRKLFDYALENFLSDVPLLFVLTVTIAPAGKIVTKGLYIGREREVFEKAVRLSQETNIDFVEKSMKKCVVYLDTKEFHSTWLGNKAIYRTRMAMADGGELLVLAPGVERFGEDGEVDKLIRKYGYRGRLNVLEQYRANSDLMNNMSAAAHLIHGSSDGRFKITYAVKEITQQEILGVNFGAADYGETIKKYDPQKLEYGWNTLDGEEVFFIPNPALGLWIDRSRFG